MDFFNAEKLPDHVITGHYHLLIVFFSLFVSFIASYAAFKITTTLKNSTVDRLNYWLWFASGALVMGSGIWTMHFIGMEALVMDFAMEYDVNLTLLSLMVAIGASALAFYLVMSSFSEYNRILYGGTMMGLAIASMHYIGMAGMLHITIQYIPSLFILSVVVAIVASQAALWMLVRSMEAERIIQSNIVCAMIMGGAICGMHYIGMAAAVMVPDETHSLLAPHLTHHGLPPLYLGISTSLIMLIFLALSINAEKFLRSLQQTNKELVEKELVLEKAIQLADQANQAKMNFLANMSHEMRTPLNGIIGTLSLMDFSDLSEKDRKFIDRIKVASQLLLNLVNEVLDFSKIEVDAIGLSLTPFDFLEVVKEIIQVLKAAADKKDLEVLLCFPSNQKLTVMSDRLRVQQILTNLLGNAIKFSEKGQIFVTILIKDETKEKVTIRLEVKDQGIGIKAEDFDKIFKKFTQVDESFTRKYGGTGLGLVISKKLVELLGGKIGFESQFQEGSTFWFEIPFTRPFAATSEEESYFSSAR